jgi:hypothetical protein
MIAAWSLAAPYDGTPDEIDHIVRAVGVVSGDLAPSPAAAKRGSGAFQTVPAGLVRPNCWAFDPTRSAACAVPPSSDSNPVSAPTGAGRYHPAYYAIVGWPLVWWPGWPGVLMARLVSGAMAAALLAGALASITRCPRHRLMTAGLVLAITPMATCMASAVNPNGVEIAAGAAFFTALITLFVGEPAAASRSLLLLGGSGAVVLATFRVSGLLWLAVGAVAVLVPYPRGAVRNLLGRRGARLWIVLVAVAAVTTVMWATVMRATDLGDYSADRFLTISQAALVEMENWRRLLDEMVGVTGWLDTRMSTAFYLSWQLLAGSLLVAGFIAAGWGDRWRTAVLVVGGFAVPAALEVRYANETGFVAQGRYFLPVLAGVLLLAGHVLDRSGLPDDRSRSALRIGVVVVLPIHLVCLIYSMVRWQHGLPPMGEIGISDLNPLVGDWQPLVGPVVPLLVEITGLVLLAALVERLPAAAAGSTEVSYAPWPRSDRVARR